MRAGAAALAALLACAPAAAQDAAPETSPAPAPRPDPEDRLGAMEAAGAVPSEAEEDETPGLTAGEIVPEGDPEGREALPAMWERLAETEGALASCLAALDALGAEYETAAPVTDPAEPDCGVANPVVLSALAPAVELAPPATLRCETALALSAWAQSFVVPAAEALGRGALTGIDLAGDYQCRRRGNAPDGVLSEHAFGNAVDVVGFRFAEGEPVAVEPREDEGTLAEAFQRSARATSCLGFTTVLGPGTDAAHANHLHMDVKARRGAYRLCQ